MRTPGLGEMKLINTRKKRKQDSVPRNLVPEPIPSHKGVMLSERK